MPRPSELLVACALGGALAAGACRRPAPSAPVEDRPVGAERANDLPVGRVNGVAITEAELRAATGAAVTAQERRHAERTHLVRREALDALLAKRLLRAEAEARGTTPDALLRDAVAAGAPEPTDADARAFYERQGRFGQEVPPFPKVRPRILEILRAERAARAKEALVARLERAAGVERLLPPLLLPARAPAADGPALGAPDAPVTVVAFTSPGCPFSRELAPALKALRAAYPKEVRIVHKELPLPLYPGADKAAEAIHCAGDLGKREEMRERVLAGASAPDRSRLADHARALALDVARFEACVDGGAKAALVAEAKRQAASAEVTSTPALFINGRLLADSPSAATLKAAVEASLPPRRS
jgi:thiol-disulfide isomerase/thioredoxin